MLEMRGLLIFEATHRTVGHDENRYVIPEDNFAAESGVYSSVESGVEVTHAET